MSDTLKLVFFYIVIFLANIMQTITGFAGTVLAMPFSIILVGSDTARFVLNILGIAASIGVVALNFKSIVWKEVIKICAIMLVGMVVGFIIIQYANISRQILYFILAGFVLLFTVIGCYNIFIKKQDNSMPANDSKIKEALLYVLLIVAGVVHGMFVCGGPLLIIYATKKLPEKNQFRSTLSMVWIVLNSVNLVRDIIAGTFKATGDMGQMFVILAISLIVLVGAVVVGNLVAKKLSKKAFIIITYVLMAISAVSLILNACGVF